MSEKQVKENLFEADKLQVIGFKIISGQIKSPEDFDEDLVNGHTFNVDLQMGFNLEEDLIRSEFKVNVSTESDGKNEDEASGAFDFRFFFKLENLNDCLEESEKGELRIDKFLGNAISSITFSTSRGILLTRFQGTALENFILPVVNPNDLLIRDV